ncbi:MAG: TolB family protein [Myxococcota bacterium]
MRRHFAAVGMLLTLSLTTLACKKPQGGGHAIGGVGKAVATGAATDLRVSPDGKHAAFLIDAEKPRLEGVPPQMLVGELHTAALETGTSKKAGNVITNVPGGYLFSSDSRWLFFLAGYNAAEQSGELNLLDLSDPATDPRKLGSNVTYMLASPDGKWLAFVEEGVLKLSALEGGAVKEIAGEVSTAQFSPDGKTLYFKRRLSAAGGLFFVSLDKPDAPKRLADQVGDYSISPDSKYVAFAQRSDVVRNTYDLFHASRPEMKPVKLAGGTALFAFSPDGQWLARTEGGKPELIGDLVIGSASGGPGRKLAERVQEFSFAPDSTAIGYLEHYDIAARAGLVGVATLPDGKPKRVGERSPNFTWGADGRYLAFLSRFLKPIYSVDLMLYPVGAEEAFKVHAGVFGYGFGPKNEYLLYRSGCIRDGRACDLYELDLSKPKEPAKKAAEGIYSFRPAEDGARVLLSYARLEKGEYYDVAVLNRKTQERKTLDQWIHLPAHFLDSAGSRISYVIAHRSRAGVYIADTP